MQKAQNVHPIAYHLAMKPHETLQWLINLEPRERSSLGERRETAPMGSKRKG